jgi:tetratricopeptide (TPR) repeat protein
MKYTSLFFFFVLALSLGACKSKQHLPKTKVASVQLSDGQQRVFDYYFYEGLRFKEEAQPDKALEFLYFAYGLNPHDGGVLSEIANVYLAAGNAENAMAFSQKAYAADPSNWWYSLRMISLLATQNNLAQAIEVALKTRQHHPKKVEAYEILSTLYRQTKQNAKALDVLEQMEKLTGINEQLAIQKFYLNLSLNRNKKAIAEIDKLVAKYPAETRYRVLRGDIFMQQGDSKTAYAIYQQVMADDPQNPFVYVSLAEYYEVVNQPAKAMEMTESALRNEKLGVEEKMEILGQYVQKLSKDTVRLDKTESLFRLLIDAYPLEEQVHAYYSIFLRVRNRTTELMDVYETMINLNDKNEQTWFQLIQLHIENKDFEMVGKTALRAIEAMPQASQWYFYNGIANFQLERYDEALAAYLSALPLLGDDKRMLRSDFYGQIGDTHYKMGNHVQAFEAYENAIANNPQNIVILNNYAYYLSLKNEDLKKAERMSAITIEKEPTNSIYLDTYGWIFYMQGNYSLARMYLKMAVDNLKPDHNPSEIFDHYGDVLYKLGEKESALEMWKKSLAAGNETEDLKRKIENKSLE